MITIIVLASVFVYLLLGALVCVLFAKYADWYLIDLRDFELGLDFETEGLTAIGTVLFWPVFLVGTTLCFLAMNISRGFVLLLKTIGRALPETAQERSERELRERMARSY